MMRAALLKAAILAHQRAMNRIQTPWVIACAVLVKVAAQTAIKTLPSITLKARS